MALNNFGPTWKQLCQHEISETVCFIAVIEADSMMLDKNEDIKVPQEHPRLLNIVIANRNVCIG